MRSQTYLQVDTTMWYLSLFYQGKETPLHIAARTKDGEKCADMLLKSGADVNATKEVYTR